MKLIIQWSLLLLLFGCDSSEKTDIKFDSEKWKTEKESRYLMIDDIIENDLLDGKSKAEVVEMLGNPTEEGPCTNCVGYATNAPDQGFSIDHEVIHINFDEQNKVKDVYLNYW